MPLMKVLYPKEGYNGSDLYSLYTNIQRFAWPCHFLLI